MGDFAVPQREVRVKVLIQDGRALSGEVYVPETGPYGEPGHLIDRLNQESEDFLALKVDHKTHLIQETRILKVTVLDGDIEEQIERQIEDSARKQHLLVKIHLTSGDEIIATLSYVQPLGHERLQDYLNTQRRFIPVRSQNQLVYINRRQIVSVVGLRGEQDGGV